jgi:acetolactate decarboxylase
MPDVTRPTRDTDLEGAPAVVRWVGAQRDVLAGDVSGRIALESIASLPHLHGLGPVEGLRGEISIFDGAAVIARVHHGGVRIESGFRERACFLVYAQVQDWLEDPVVSFDDVDALEALLLEAAARHRVDAASPFPFRLLAPDARVRLHVLDKRDDRPHNAAEHEKAKVRFVLEHASIEVIGFYSTRHRGVFTPGDSDLHMHVRTLDGTMSGHVEALAARAGARISLPGRRLLPRTRSRSAP